MHDRTRIIEEIKLKDTLGITRIFKDSERYRAKTDKTSYQEILGWIRDKMITQNRWYRHM